MRSWKEIIESGLLASMTAFAKSQWTLRAISVGEDELKVHDWKVLLPFRSASSYFLMLEASSYENPMKMCDELISECHPDLEV